MVWYWYEKKKLETTPNRTLTKPHRNNNNNDDNNNSLKAFNEAHILMHTQTHYTYCINVERQFRSAEAIIGKMTQTPMLNQQTRGKRIDTKKNPKK